jgi:hypothetical protein
MHSLFRKIHIYGGLACFWYLVILGISSLQFNHHFGFMEHSADSTVWESRILPLDPKQDDLKLAESIRDSLSIMGWPLPWRMWRDSASLFFEMEQPAKRYFITYTFDNGTLHVVETGKGFWRVFNSLHGAGKVPNGPFTMLWHWYTRMTILIVILSVFTGIYIWLKSKQDKKTGLALLSLTVSGTIFWMLKLYLWG